MAIAAKVVTGVFYAGRRWQVGWAMVGRGELGFVMATSSYRRGQISSLAFSVTVWALLVATLISPIVLRRILPPEPRRTRDDDEGVLEPSKDGALELKAGPVQKC